MGYKVIFAAQAERDLADIVGFLAAKSPAAAEKLGLALVDSAIALGELPRRGVPVRGRPGVHKCRSGLTIPSSIRSAKAETLSKSCASGTVASIRRRIRCRQYPEK